LIAHEQAIDNAVDPALLRADEEEISTPGSLVSHAESFPITTTPVHVKDPKASKGTKRQRTRSTVSDKPSMATFAERISNEVSDFIAETRASKRTSLAEDQLAFNQNPSSISSMQPASVPHQFQPYREALALLMTMYKEGKFSVGEIGDAIDLLESMPIRCVTVVGLTEERREGSLKRAIRVRAQQPSVLN